MAPAYRVIISPEAAVEPQAIHAYLSQDSPANAARMVGRILDAIEKLEIIPHRNIVQRRSRKTKHPIRSLPVKPYMVFFRVLDEHQAVVILSVRHGARGRPRF